MLQELVPETKQQKQEIKKHHLEHVKEIAKPKPAKKSVSKVRVEPVNAGTVIVEPVSVTTDVTCPKCGNNLVVRNGKRGSFYGCQGYPKCRFTRDL